MEKVKNQSKQKNQNLFPWLQQAYSQIKEFMTDNQRAHIFLKEGKIRMECGEYRAAIDCFGEGISFSPMLCQLYLNRATCYKYLYLWTEAYFDYSFAIRLEPDSAVHFSCRGVCLAKMSKNVAAIEDLDFACHLEPIPSHYFTRGSIFSDVRQYENAIRDFSLAIAGEQNEKSELKIRLYYRRALAHFELKQHAEVRRDLGALLLQDPNNIQARLLLGKSLKLTGDLREAEDQLSRTLLLDPTNPALLSERGEVRVETGIREKVLDAILDFDKAVSSLQKRVLKLISSPENLSQHPDPSPVPLPDPSPLSISVEADHDPNPCLPSSHPHLYQLVHGLEEAEDQLADCLVRRGQAKLLAEAHPIIIQSALQDAQTAMRMRPEDEDYPFTAVSALIRLSRYSEATSLLSSILSNHPQSDRALFSQAYCHRSSGSHLSAIENLTQIIAVADVGDPSLRPDPCIPLCQVFEARGSIFHEIQAHKYALTDFGRAISLNPQSSDCYFLRADCHSRLGNHEAALRDLDLACSLGFSDRFSLVMLRASLNRLMGRPADADRDLLEALNLIPKDSNQKIVRLKILMFRSLSLIDLRQSSQALEVLLEVQAIISSFCIKEKPRVPTPLRGRRAHLEAEEEETEPTLNQRIERMIEALSLDFLMEKESSASLGSHPPPSKINEAQRILSCSLVRARWSVTYHCALVMFDQRQFSFAERLLSACVNENYDQAEEGLGGRVNKSACPDEYSLGCVYFFLGITQGRIDKPQQAVESLTRCLESNWSTVTRHHSLCLFTLGKMYQVLGQHSKAVERFSEALEEPEDESLSPFILFRRGWSHKAQSKYSEAGSDFEGARRMRPSDPNFSVDYKRCHSVEYIELQSEPDLTEPFPPLLAIN